MLFFAGTRDSLCNLEKLKGVLNKIKISSRLEIVDSGDHSFKLPKKMGLSQKDVWREILNKTLAWLSFSD